MLVRKDEKKKLILNYYKVINPFRYGSPERHVRKKRRKW